MGNGWKRAIAAAKATNRRCDWLVDCKTAKRDPKCANCAKAAEKAKR